MIHRRMMVAIGLSLLSLVAATGGARAGVAIQLAQDGGEMPFSPLTATQNTVWELFQRTLTINEGLAGERHADFAEPGIGNFNRNPLGQIIELGDIAGEGHYVYGILDRLAKVTSIHLLRFHGGGFPPPPIFPEDLAAFVDLPNSRARSFAESGSGGGGGGGNGLIGDGDGGGGGGGGDGGGKEGDGGTIPVPEPGTMFALLIGPLSMCFKRRRK